MFSHNCAHSFLVHAFHAKSVLLLVKFFYTCNLFRTQLKERHVTLSHVFFLCFLQLYKQNVLGEIREFIPLIIKTIVLQPSMQARSVHLLVESILRYCNCRASSFSKSKGWACMYCWCACFTLSSKMVLIYCIKHNLLSYTGSVWLLSCRQTRIMHRHVFCTSNRFQLFIHFFSFFRSAPSFNKEIYVDFVAAQIKTLSFLAFIIRAYQVSRRWFDCSYIKWWNLSPFGRIYSLYRWWQFSSRFCEARCACLETTCTCISVCCQQLGSNWLFLLKKNTNIYLLCFTGICE